ncbi:MAG: carbohydrate kinase family protein, partial [Bacteroidota bacterium]|nr:carbohydrate kinase family protein [Bacteroidota bacterium]
MNEKNILVVGELNIDIIADDINGFPVIGHEILANKLNITLGSSSAIFASNIATLGVNTWFCGVVGKDSFGEFILDELKNKNVDTSYISQSEKYKTGVTIVLNYSQDRANITHCGAMNALDMTCIPLTEFSKCNHLHFSSYFLQKGIQADVVNLFKAAKERGLTTSLDIQWDPNNKWDFPYKDCLPFVDIFLPNESEILMLSGESELNKALEKIGEFANLVVVKLGTRGAIAFEKGTITCSKPFLHNDFIDAIGAGDSFNAGFISKYLSQCSLEESLQFANLAGAINT